MGLPSTPDSPPRLPEPKVGILDVVERLGNKLPEPAILFALLAAAVVVLSTVGASLGWEVQPVKPTVQMVPQADHAGLPVMNDDGSPAMTMKLDGSGKPEVKLEPYGSAMTPRSLASSEGVYWMLSSMLRNFATLAALPLVFVGMLGIGLAEKFGLFSALMRVIALNSPRWLLTPVIVFVGANSSVASDAGYIILPPLAAALYAAIGRSPIAGMAAAFCGVAGGFGGGLLPTASDGFLAGVATQAAHIVDLEYPDVVATHNLYFKAASSIVVTLAGWYVTDRIVEPRLRRQLGEHTAETSAIHEMALQPREKRGLLAAVATMALLLAGYFATITVPGLPLHGDGTPALANGRVAAAEQISIVDQAAYAAAPPDRKLFSREPPIDPATGQTLEPGYYVVSGTAAPTLIERPGRRWSQVIVPMIFLGFLLPGMVYGWFTGVLRSQRDLIEGIHSGIRTLVPVLVIMFFLAQFVNYFQYTGLDRMLAYAGGSLLVNADLPVPVLLVLFVVLVIFADFAMSGMLAKFAVMAPIFIPMFMMVGISPELTTAGYRIGDSVVNVITPLNSYLLIVLAVYQKYRTSAGLGHLASLMLPYSVVLFIAWTGLLFIWWFSGLDLGTGASLRYLPGQ